MLHWFAIGTRYELDPRWSIAAEFLRAFETMAARARADKISHRTAAMAIGVEKVRAAKNTRGLFP